MDWPGCHASYGVEKVMSRDLLEHVAGCAGEDGGEERLVVVVGREDQRIDAGVDRADLTADVDATAVG